MEVVPITTIGSTPIQVSVAKTPITRGILAIAFPGNTVPVFIGRSTVTPGTDNASGVPVFPGGSAFIPDDLFFTSGDPVANTSNAWVVAASGSNSIYLVIDGEPQFSPGTQLGGPLGTTKSFPLAITTAGAGYVSGDCVGGILSITTVNFASGRPVSLKTLTLRDKNANAIAFNLYFFKATPAAGTYTDNGALAWGTGDAANLVGQVKIQAGDWLTDAGQSSVCYSGLDMMMPVGATTLFALLVAEGAGTLTNANLTADFEFDQK